MPGLIRQMLPKAPNGSWNCQSAGIALKPWMETKKRKKRDGLKFMADQPVDGKKPPAAKPRRKQAPLAEAGLDHGMSQVSLVESALCPLDYQPGVALLHHSEFIYYDQQRKRRSGQVTVRAPIGLSPTDELILYGLLAITFADASPALELSATPHFLCRQLGLPVGGDHYGRLRESMRRLSEVTYRNSAWWDKPRAQHRDVGFHFLSHDLPSETDDPQEREPWTILWDPLFFRLMDQSRGFVWFDFATYRALKNAAARRGFLLLQKIFHHRELTPQFDLRSFAVEQLGYSADLELKSIRQKVKLLIKTWQELGIVAPAAEAETFFSKQGPGRWTLCMPRGPRFEKPISRPWPHSGAITDHPAYEILQGLELTHAEIAELFARHKDRMIYVTRVALLTHTQARQKRAGGGGGRALFLKNLDSLGFEAAQEILDRRTRSLYEQRRGEALAAWADQSGGGVTNVLESTFRYPDYTTWLAGEEAGPNDNE